MIPAPAAVGVAIAVWQAGLSRKRVYHDIRKARDISDFEANQPIHDMGGAVPTGAQYERAEAEAGVPASMFRAIAYIESAEKALYNDAPITRIEQHVWKRFDPGRAGAVDVIKPLNPSDQSARWANFLKLYKLNPEAAIRACSFGCTQIMGFNYEICGFKEPGLFLEAMKEGAGAQILATARFVSHPKNERLAMAMRKRDFAAVAHHYNGPKFKANKYDAKLKAAVERFEHVMA